MKKIAWLLICVLLSNKALPQLTPSTIGQVYNLSAGDSFEYRYVSEDEYGTDNFQGYSLMVIDTVIQTVDSFYYSGSIKIYDDAFENGYEYLSPIPVSQTPEKIGFCVDCLFSVLAPDSSIFSLYLPINSIDSMFGAADSVFINFLYNGRKQNEANNQEVESGEYDTYVNGIGLVNQYINDNSYIANQWLLYYHKASGEQWGTYTAADFDYPASISAIEEPATDARIIPNPVSDNFQLLLSTIPEKKLYLNIYNVTGQQVFQSEINSLSSTFSRGKLPSGAFLWQLTSNTQVLNRGILIFQ